MDLLVTSGSPTDVELGVICAVVSASEAPDQPQRRPVLGAWSHPGRTLGMSRNWRDSTLPPLVTGSGIA